MDFNQCNGLMVKVPVLCSFGRRSRKEGISGSYVRMRVERSERILSKAHLPSALNSRLYFSKDGMLAQLKVRLAFLLVLTENEEEPGRKRA